MRMEVNGFEELLQALNKAAVSTKDACLKAVDKAAPILKETLSGEIAKAASRGYATGDLAGSVSAMKAKENELGIFSVVGVRGADKKGIANEDKLLWLENGTNRSRGGLMKRAGPIRRRAVNSAKAECEAVMEQEINQFMGETFGE